MKKIVSFLLCACMLLGLSSLLSSCGDTSPQVIRYQDLSISQNKFIYELAMEKTAYLSENNISADEASVWSQKTDTGLTVDAACMNGLVRSEVLKLYFARLAMEKSPLTEAEKKLIDDKMAEYVGTFVDRASFDFYMNNFSVGYDEIRDLMELQYLSQKGQALLFGTGMEKEITQEDAVAFFNENFATVKHIFINNVNKTYPNQKTVPLTQEEKEEKNKQIALLESLLTPESFASHLSQSDDGFSKEGAEAVTFSKGSMDPAYEKAVFSATVGTVVKAECSAGVYFIMVEPLDASVLTEDKKKEIMTLLTEQALTEIYNLALKETTLNQEIINLYSFSEAKYFTSFEPQ